MEAPKRLSKEEAQQEAGMLRAKMEISPRTGKGPEGLELTAEDYDAALEALNELKELAAKEPAVEKVLATLGRLSAEAAMMVAYVIEESQQVGSALRNGSPSRTRTILEYKQANFEDAAYKLRQLKEAAKEYDRS